MWNRFGFEIGSELLENVIKTLGKDVKGFHFHFSTNNFRVENYKAILIELQELVSKYQIDIEYVDIGGGFPGREEFVYKNNIEKVPQIVKSVLEKEDVFVISEVGRFLVEDVFDLNTEVISIKRKGKDEADITIDTNIMQFPCFWEKKYSLDYVPKSGGDEVGKPFFVNIYGNSCMQIDKVYEKFLVHRMPEVGDHILIRNVGAYSLSQASDFITKIPDIITQ